MPPDVSTADADQDRGRTVEELERELTEAREQQSATAQILAVISGSPTDVQPVFDAIASSAARLCDALDAVVMRVDGDILRLVAHHGPMSTTGDVPLHRGTVGGRAIIERRLIHVALSEDRTVRTYSTGEGSEKRLIIAAAAGGDPPAGEM